MAGTRSGGGGAHGCSAAGTAAPPPAACAVAACSAAAMAAATAAAASPLPLPLPPPLPPPVLEGRAAGRLGGPLAEPPLPFRWWAPEGGRLPAVAPGASSSVRHPKTSEQRETEHAGKGWLPLPTYLQLVLSLSLRTPLWPSCQRHGAAPPPFSACLGATPRSCRSAPPEACFCAPSTHRNDRDVLQPRCTSPNLPWRFLQHGEGPCTAAGFKPPAALNPENRNTARAANLGLCVQDPCPWSRTAACAVPVRPLTSPLRLYLRAWEQQARRVRYRARCRAAHHGQPRARPHGGPAQRMPKSRAQMPTRRPGSPTSTPFTLA